MFSNLWGKACETWKMKISNNTEVSEVLSTGPSSAVIYSNWEFKGEEMGIKSRKRDLTEPYKLWESEHNNRKPKVKKNFLSRDF